jgi:hypothetical protein
VIKAAVAGAAAEAEGVMAADTLLMREPGSDSNSRGKVREISKLEQSTFARHQFSAEDGQNIFLIRIWCHA